MAKRKTDEYRLNMIQTIQENMTTLMQNKGWTNKDLSEATGIALSDLSKYRGIEYRTLPRVTELAKLCEAFNVTFDFMIGLDPGGRYTSLPEDEKNLLQLYRAATPRDQKLIMTILGKYQEDDNSNSES